MWNVDEWEGIFEASGKLESFQLVPREDVLLSTEYSLNDDYVLDKSDN